MGRDRYNPLPGKDHIRGLAMGIERMHSANTGGLARRSFAPRQTTASIPKREMRFAVLPRTTTTSREALSKSDARLKLA